MPKLKLGEVLDDKPVKITMELPAQLHRDLVAYAEMLGRETSQSIEPVKLIAPMLARFISADRAFSRARRNRTLKSHPQPANSGDDARFP